MVVRADVEYGIVWGGRGNDGGRGQLVEVAGDGDSGVGAGGRGHVGVRGPLVVEGHDRDRGEAGAVVAMLVGVDHSWW